MTTSWLTLTRGRAGLRCSSTTHAGARAFNEDLAVALPEDGLFVVADGAGGEGKGDRAGRMLQESLSAGFHGEEALAEANRRVFQALQDDGALKGMGLTAALVTVSGRQFTIAHVGEVRVYRLRRGSVEVLTEDHTLAGQLVRTGQLTPADALRHPARKAVTRFLGKAAGLKADLRTLAFVPGDVLVIATDGFYAGLEEQDWERFREATAGDLDAALAALLARALAGGADDNATAIALCYDAEDADPYALLLGSDAPERELCGLAERLAAPVLANPGLDSALLVAVVDGHPMLLASKLSGPEDAQTLLSRQRDRLLAATPGADVIELASDAHCRVRLYAVPAASAVLPEGWADELTAPAAQLAGLAQVVRLRGESGAIAQRFQMLNELGRAVGSSLDVEQVLHLLLEQTLKLTQATLAYVILPDGDDLRCRFGLSRDGERRTGLEISYTLARRVLASREPLCILDTGADLSAQTASVMALDLQSVMCVPMWNQDALVGLLYVSSNSIAYTFTEADLDLLIAIAGQAAVSVQNAIYVSELEEKRAMQAELARMNQELAIATRVQSALLPRRPTADGFDLALCQVTATEVGGDLIDYYPAPDGGFWLAIGDVTGHGLTSGLVMMMTQSIFAGLLAAAPELGPVDLLNRLNRTLFHSLRDRMETDHYMTLQVIRHVGQGRFVAAGKHCDMLVHRAQTGLVECLDTPGFWTGLLEETADMTVEYTFELAPGDTLLLYTDGLIEAMDARREQFDLPRVAALLAENAALPVEALQARLVDEVSAWLHAQQDDISTIVLRRR